MDEGIPVDGLETGQVVEARDIEELGQIRNLLGIYTCTLEGEPKELFSRRLVADPGEQEVGSYGVRVVASQGLEQAR